MIICLTGENDFGWRAELEKLVRAFTLEHGDMAIERLDGEEASFERLQESVQSLPFLTARKLVILDAPGAQKQFVERTEQLIRELPETTDLIILEPKLDKRLAYYKFLKKTTDFREYAGLDEDGLTRWLIQTAKEQGGTLTQADARLLVARIGLDQRLLAGELEKLLLYNPTVSRQTIELLTEAAPQSTVFELLEAAFAGNAPRALALYRNQREQRVDPAQIIAMLAWQLRVLALIKTAGKRSGDDIARSSKLNPFVVRKSQPVAARLAAGQLKHLIAGLLAIDIRSKRMNIDLDEALENFLLCIATT